MSVPPPDGGDRPAAADRLKDRYRLQEVVGEGGMAVVWRAEDELLGRTVAVKILRPQYANDPEFLARLRTEARSAAALSDPGVVAVYDVGSDDGRHFIVMEYVAGRDLKAIIRDEGALAPARVVAIGTAIARAVGAAHAMGLVHRDIKPQNVMVSASGRIKVADFGIARAVSAVGTTAPGVVLGTVHYLAPELAAGGAATPASDVYSLGVVLYEALTGRLPFDADSSVGVAMRILNEAPESIEKVNPLVPAGLAAIVHRSMARSPEDRYPDAASLAEALEAYGRYASQATAEVPRVAPPHPSRGAARPAANVPAPRTARSPSAGPLFDATGLFLAIVALLALAGLIPLWGAVRERVRTPGLPIGWVAPIVGGSGAGEAAEPGPTATVQTVEVPNLVGLAQAEAEAALEARSLSSTVTLETSDRPAGEVIRQSPDPGAQVPLEKVVELVVSDLPTQRVPSVEGSWAEVSAVLEQMGYVPVQRSQWGVSAGQVVQIDPPPGTTWPRGAPVNVTVGSGSWLPLGVDFAENIHLSGVDVLSARARPGEPFQFTATWEATDTAPGEGTPAVTRGDYVVRAVLADDAGNVVAADEHVPAGGSRPTSGWQPGEVVRGDMFTLPIDPAATPGELVLWLDLHRNGDPAAVLPIVRASFGHVTGDRVQVLRVELESPGT